MRNKLIETLNGIFDDENCPMSAGAVGRIADRLMAEGFGLRLAKSPAMPGCSLHAPAGAVAADREVVGQNGPCIVGDSVFVLYFNEENGKTEVDELKVNEVSGRRFWIAGDDGFDYGVDEIGKNVFLTREDAVAFSKSQEYLNQRVSFVKLLNVSDHTKRELLWGVLEVGQEYVESDGKRSIRLTEKKEPDFWKFDVFDRNGEWMYATSAFQWGLADEILNGKLVPKKEIAWQPVYSKIANEIELIGESDIAALTGYGNFPTIAEIQRDYNELMDIIKDVRTPEQAKALADKTGMIVEVNGERVDDFMENPLFEGTAPEFFRYEYFGCLHYVYDRLDGEPMFDVWSNAAYDEFIRDVSIGDLTEKLYEDRVAEEVERLVERGEASREQVDQLIASASRTQGKVPERLDDVIKTCENVSKNKDNGLAALDVGER